MSRELWDARYADAAAADETVWSSEPNAFIASVLTGATPGTAVDLGCGEGRNAIWLARQGWGVTAVDFSAVGLETGRRRAAAAEVEVTWELADATTWVSPELVDLVVVAYLQLPAASLRAALAAASGYLAPGGRLVLVGHALENLAHGVGGPRNADLLHRVADLRAGASTLDIERCELVDRPVDEGIAIDAVLIARQGQSSAEPRSIATT